MKQTTHTDLVGKVTRDIKDILTTGVRVWTTPTGVRITQPGPTQEGEDILLVITLNNNTSGYTVAVDTCVSRIQEVGWDLVEDVILTTRGINISGGND